MRRKLLKSANAVRGVHCTHLDTLFVQIVDENLSFVPFLPIVVMVMMVMPATEEEEDGEEENG